MSSANPFTVWEAMGQPTYPNRTQLEELHAASEMKVNCFIVMRLANLAMVATLCVRHVV